MFTLLVLIYVIGVGLALDDKSQRIGQPDTGFSLEGNNVSPTRWEAAAAGLWGGGQSFTVNGIAATRLALKDEIPQTLARSVGATNTIRVRQNGFATVPHGGPDAARAHPVRASTAGRHRSCDDPLR